MRIAPRAFFVTVHGQDGRANRERTGRLRACCPDLAEYRQGIGVSAEAKARQPECCPS
jgi:hypothetical protein